MTNHVPDFVVLLGPDYAGKSSAMSELAVSGWPWRLVSVDDALLPPAYPVIAGLRRHLLRDVLSAPAGTYSPDFTASLLQTAAVHLRDRLVEPGDDRPVLVDSYYYKLLAKCRLTGSPEHPLFAWWRSFPQPRGVVYLDVDPATAWSRSGAGAATNRLEHYGERVDEASFRAFQTDLRVAMLTEVRHLDLVEIQQQGSPADTADTVRKVLSDEFR
ncbi:hypothetical protein ACIQMJ_34175 [Actinosynnema sp. NPDC091369]